MEVVFFMLMSASFAWGFLTTLILAIKVIAKREGEKFNVSTKYYQFLILLCSGWAAYGIMQYFN